MVRGRSSGYQVSVKPKFTKGFCRPFRHNNENFECSPGLLRIFNWASGCFRKLAKEKKICLPSSLLFKEEREELQETLQEMKEMEANKERYEIGYIHGWNQYNAVCGYLQES